MLRCLKYKLHKSENELFRRTALNHLGFFVNEISVIRLSKRCRWNIRWATRLIEMCIWFFSKLHIRSQNVIETLYRGSVHPLKVSDVRSLSKALL